MRHLSFFVLIILLFTCSCSQPKVLVYKNIQNFRLKQVGVKQTEVSMEIRFFNPNNYGLRLKKANVDVFINDTKLGKMLVREGFAIPGLDTFALPVVLNVDVKNVLPNALQLLLNPEVDIKLSGTVKAGRHGIYIKVPVNYEGKQDIRSSIKL